MGAIRTRLASVTLFACIGLLAGCGDDLPASSSGTAGSGGGGTTGAGGGGGGGTTGLGGGGGGGTTGVGGGGGGGTTGTGGGGAGGGGTGGGGSGGGGTAGGGGGGGGTGGTGGAAGRGGGGGAGTTGTGGGGSGGGGTTGSGGAGTTGTGGGGGTTGSGGAGTTGTGGGGTGGGGTTGSGGAGTTGTGGGGTGGGGTTGTGGGGTGGTACYTVAFTTPTNNQTLTVAQDKNTSCVDGLQYDVVITTNAPAGTDVSLYNGSALLATVQVANGGATFPAVGLGFTGTAALQIQFPSTAACTDPSTGASVTVSCSNAPPTCDVTQPTISATHPDLNGVQAPAGDRTSSAGSPYQATFVVTTSAEDGQPIALQITDGTTNAVTTASTTANGGSGSAGVSLVPDGHSYNVVATCTNKNGISATSATGTFPVDYTPPDLTVSSPTDGQFFGPSQLSNGAFQVCGQTTAIDAAGLLGSLGPAQKNFCVSIGASTSCIPVLAVSTPTCIGITCPGGAPFDLTVTLSDAAGNPTSKTISGVSCASSLPSVQIVSPVSDSPGFANQARRILSATATVGIPDKDGATAGAQADVLACTDTSGTAALLVGQVGGGALSQIASAATTIAVGADSCPAGLGFAAHFTNILLPESTEAADGTLTAATEIAVAVTSGSQPITGTSAPVDVWVDSGAPAISLSSPGGLCGSFQQASGTVIQDVAFNADDALVTLQVVNGGSTHLYPTPTFAGGVATFTTVVFDQGQNNVTAAVADPAGNTTAFATNPCSVTIGAAPVVTFTAPTGTNILCPVGSTAPNCIPDGDGSTGGWQGSLVVHVTASGQAVTSGNVTFTSGGNTLGTGALNGTGDATVAGITLPEGSDVIVATTDNIAGAGVGSGSVTVTVDLTAPNAPSALTSTVPPADRRKTAMQLAWTAPTDVGGANVTGYQVRYAKVPIDASNFDNPAVTTAVPYIGTPAVGGQPDGISVGGLYIENGYYFAVAATDGAGNRSAITATPPGGVCTCNNLCCAAHFNVTLINSPTGTNQQFGTILDGSADVNGDGISDLAVASVNNGHAYLFFGGANFAPSVPAVTFSGSNASFGGDIRFVGDIDGDGLPDLAISDQTAVQVLIYKGRLSWPLTLSDAQADYTITTDATWAASAFGFSMAALGDFDGDGVDDFVIGAPSFNVRVGRAVVIYGRSGFTSFGLPDTGRSLEIGGDASLNRTQFGLAVTGLGHFYSVTTGTTLIVSAPGLGNATSTSSNEGRVYAFHGQGPGGAVTATAADNVTVGPGKGALVGQTLANLGAVINGLPSVGVGNPSDTLSVPGSTGSAFALSGTAALGPFASLLVLNQPGVNAAGQVILGGGFSGRDVAASLIGDGKADIGMASQAVGTFDIIDGSKISGLTSPSNAKTVGDVHVPMPSGWVGNAPGTGNLIRDIDGDGVPDFALGDLFGVIPGRVAVFW